MNEIKFENYITLLQLQLKEKLSEELFIHSKNVCLFGIKLANIYKPNKVRFLQRVIISSLLHDYCKEYPISSYELIKKDDQKFYKIYHSLYAPYFLKKELNIKSRKILNAVKFHSTGKPKMNLLEKIVYLADYLGDGKTSYNQDVLKSSITSINKACYLKTLNNINYLKNNNQTIHINQYKTLKYYQKYKEE